MYSTLIILKHSTQALTSTGRSTGICCSFGKPLTRNCFLPGKNCMTNNSARKLFQECCPKSKISWKLKLKADGLGKPLKYALGFGGSCAIYSLKNTTHASCLSVKHLFNFQQHEVPKAPPKPKGPAFDWKKFFWTLLWPDIGLFISAIISALIVAGVNIQIPLLLGDIVNVISDSIDNAMGSSFLSVIQRPLTNTLFMYALQGGFTFSYIAILSALGENIAARFRQQLFSSIMKQDIAFFDTHKTGEIVNRLSTDIQDFKSAFKSCISQGLKNLAQVSGSMVTLYMVSPKLTLIMSVVLPCIITAGTMIGAILRKLANAAHAQVEQAISVADEAIGNMRTVRAFAMEDKEISLFNKELSKSATMNTILGFGIGVFQGMSNIALNGVVLLVLCVGGELMGTHDLNKGQLMSFMVATQTIQRSLMQLSLLLGNFVRGMSSAARVYEFINSKPTMPLKGGIKLTEDQLFGSVEFKNVTFAYPTRPGQVILKDFSLNIPQGNIVALCGVSGGGKSTIAALIERFYDVDAGSVNIDGVDIRTLDPSWLRGEIIGFISQEPVLFATSIMENIRYGAPGATDEQVIEAAKLANADSFISAFPMGYKTVLGERGVTISGGQKQRVAIARAIIKNPKILILDEATSALDAESEKVVQDTLDTLMEGRTVLVIAHRLSTIQKASVIAVLVDGAIAEMGTHEELKSLQGLYWNLNKHQEKVENVSEMSEGGDAKIT